MAKKARYAPRDIQYLDRLYLLEMKAHLAESPTDREIDFLEEKIVRLREKIEHLKTTLYKQKDSKQITEDFYRKNLSRQSIYLELLLEKKIVLEGKRRLKAI